MRAADLPVQTGHRILSRIKFFLPIFWMYVPLLLPPESWLACCSAYLWNELLQVILFITKTTLLVTLTECECYNLTTVYYIQVVKSILNLQGEKQDFFLYKWRKLICGCYFYIVAPAQQNVISLQTQLQTMTFPKWKST